MDVTAGETATRAKGPLIDLGAASSAMDSLFARSREPQVAKVQGELQMQGMALCKCGAGRPGYSHAGPVPAWFGRDCIEGQCPLRVAA